MIGFSPRRLILASAGVAALFGVIGVADAATGEQAPTPIQSAVLGAPVSIRVAVHSPADGKPVANTPLVFHTDASFARVTDEVELGRATTNADGVAVLAFEPHMSGDHEVRVDYEDVGRKVNLAKVTVSVSGDSQLVHSTAGVNIPGLNIWLLVSLIAGIWSILLSVSFRVISIARGGGASEATFLAADPSLTPTSPTEADR